MPFQSQLSAISPFKRNNLINQSADNLSQTSSVSSWTDRSYNNINSPASKAFQNLKANNIVLSDTDSIKSEGRSGRASSA